MLAEPAARLAVVEVHVLHAVLLARHVHAVHAAVKRVRQRVILRQLFLSFDLLLCSSHSMPLLSTTSIVCTCEPLQVLTFRQRADQVDNRRLGRRLDDGRGQMDRLQGTEVLA